MAALITGFWTVDEKAFGPDHLYVVAETKEEVNVILAPAQIGEVPDTAGVRGALLTVTVVDEGRLIQPLALAVTEYTPAFRAVTFEIEGFCKVDVKPFGPTQLKLYPADIAAVRFNVVPEQTGLFEDAMGEGGIALMITLVDAMGLTQLLTVT